jgi:hypothetical protein
MRIVILLLLCLPFIGKTQINRSANELAREVSAEYLRDRIFKGKNYQPIWFGELKPRSDKKGIVAWTMEHKFVISDKDPAGFRTTSDSIQSFSFLLFLDRKMKVLKAESHSVY